MTPPQYGKVFITIKPFYGPFVPDSIKNNLKTMLRKYSVAGIITEIQDLKYLYVEVDVNAYYNPSLAPDANAVQTIVANNINSYADSADMNKYGAKFKYSKFQAIIDNSNDSITSNITKVEIRRDMQPKLNQVAEYELCFGNPFYIKSYDGYNIKSSGFNIFGVSDTVYLSDIPKADGRTGSLFFFRLQAANSPIVVSNNVGTIDYKSGVVTLNPVNVQSGMIKDGQTIIEISACPLSNDVIGLQDLYLQLDINNSNFEMVVDEIASGLDPSGSNYITSSSYANGSLVRPGGRNVATTGGTAIAPTTTTSTTTTSTTSPSTSGSSY